MSTVEAGVIQLGDRFALWPLDDDPPTCITDDSLVRDGIRIWDMPTDEPRASVVRDKIMATYVREEPYCWWRIT